MKRYVTLGIGTAFGIAAFGLYGCGSDPEPVVEETPEVVAPTPEEIAEQKKTERIAGLLEEKVTLEEQYKVPLADGQNPWELASQYTDSVDKNVVDQICKDSGFKYLDLESSILWQSGTPYDNLMKPVFENGVQVNCNNQIAGTEFNLLSLSSDYGKVVSELESLK